MFFQLLFLSTDTPFVLSSIICFPGSVNSIISVLKISFIASISRSVHLTSTRRKIINYKKTSSVVSKLKNFQYTHANGYAMTQLFLGKIKKPLHTQKVLAYFLDRIITVCDDVAISTNPYLSVNLRNSYKTYINCMKIE